jgi:hypothetical protein
MADTCPDCTAEVLTDGGPLGAQVKVFVSHGMPVEVLDVISPATPDSPGSFRIRNASTAGLVTLFLKLTFVSNKGEHISRLHRVDSWDRDLAFLGPGRAAAFPLGVRVDGSLAEVEVTPVFAEFDDGTRLGSAAATLRPCLLGERQAFLTRLQQLRATFRVGGQTALSQAIEKADLGWLLVRWAEQGAQAVVAELTKTRHLRP